MENEAVLLKLAQDDSSTVRKAVAHYEGNLPVSVQVVLVADKVILIRSGLATRHDLADKIRNALLKDEDRVVRSQLAANLSTPANVLDALIEDEEWVVRKHAASNKNLSVEAFEMILFGRNREDWDKDMSDGEFWAEKALVTVNSALPVALMEELVAEWNPVPRILTPLMCNPSCPLDLVEQVASTTSFESVRKVAVQRLSAEHPRFVEYPAEWMEAAFPPVNSD